ncbi:MAG TPA: hypothetical protein VMI74_16645 [Burkholderiales bacterium]|nr:hypothetical protein [Burkholderiales bacterium]
MSARNGFVAAILLTASLPVAAGDISNIGGLTQDEFHRMSQDLGAALSYKPLTPAEPLGLFGFDVGVAGTDTKIKNSDVFQKAGTSNLSDIVVPSLRANVGLPFGIDVGAMAGEAPGTNIRLYGGELRWAFIKGSTAMPALALRGSYTQLSGVDQLDFNTKGADLSISKGFAFITPYGGIGKVWVTGTPKNIPGSTPSQESFSQNKYFAGINMNFVLVNVVVEADKTGDDTSYGLKLGFRF